MEGEDWTFDMQLVDDGMTMIWGIELTLASLRHIEGNVSAVFNLFNAQSSVLLLIECVT